MNHKKARVTALAGVGATAGALLAGALISAAAASADVDIDGLHGNRTEDVTTNQNVDIFNNYGPNTTVDVNAPDQDAVQNFDITDNYRSVTTNITTAADDAGVTVEGNNGPTTTDITTTNSSYLQEPGYITGNNDVVATIENNSDQTDTTITGSGPTGESATAATAIVEDNSGSTTVNFDNVYSADATTDNNTGPVTLSIDDLSHLAGANATIGLAGDSGAVTINAPGDTTGFIDVYVQDSVTGPVTADIDGSTMTLADGYEYEFFNGVFDAAYAL